MLRIIHSLFSVLFCSVLLGQSSLSYEFKEGDKFIVQQNAKQYITQQLEEVTHEMENNISGLMEFKVTGAKEDLYEINMSFLDLGMHMTSNLQGELMSIEANEIVEGDVQSRIFNSLLHVPIQIILSKSGNVLSVHGGEKLITKMVQASGLTDEESKSALKESLKGEFGSEALSNSFRQMTYIYPENIDATVTQWANEYSGKLSAKNLWTLEKTSQTGHHIKGQADITMNITDAGTTMSLTGKQETTITTDATTGFILDMLVEGFSEGTTMTEFSGDMEIPTSVRSNTSYKLIRD